MPHAKARATRLKPLYDLSMRNWIFLSAMIAGSALAQTNGWKLVWSDEFNGAAGTAPNPANWNFDLGGGGWGNGEAEVYTSSLNNAFLDGKGNLVIRAIKDAQGNYTSARLQTGAPGAGTSTADLSWQYGLIQARIKLPFGKGVWPAFWMLGENIGTVGWPTCGELDIMENFGTFNNNVSINNGTPHGPGFSNVLGLSKQYTLPFGETVHDDFHVYSIQWSQDSIIWSVDGTPYNTVTPASLPAGSTWPFNAPAFILLNLAIGGSSTFLGTPDASVNFPQDMLVDWVRVYQAAPASATTPVITPGRVVNGASYLGAISPGSLAVVYGTNLAGAEHLIQASPNFPTSVAGVSVSVNGVLAPLIYVSPGQINFQVPWETPVGSAPVVVTWNGAQSSAEIATVAATASPSFFLSEYVNGVVWMTGALADGCPTVASECSPKAGAIYQLWANGLGPVSSALQDGAPAPLAALPVQGGCSLTIGGQPASVLYCGVAPGEIIDQVNFAYPTGVSSNAGYVQASLSAGGVTGLFRLPAPGN
jgi:uncharacterized protein (TIGR03437 family)